MRINDFDNSIEQAWRDFGVSLARECTQLTREAGTWIALGPATAAGSHLRLHITLTGAHRVRVTLDSTDLHSDVARHLLQAEQLRTLGWRRLRNGTYILERSPSRADDLAATTVTTVRAVWGVVHPAFLDAPFLEHQGPDTPSPFALTSGATIPCDPDHLRSLTLGFLAAAAGHPVDPDDDGDIPLPTPGYPSWLRVAATSPCLELFAILTDDATDHARAASLIATQPTDHASIRLILRGRTIVAQRIIDASVFVADNVRMAMNDWFTFVRDDVPRIVQQALDDESKPSAADSECEDLPDAILTVMHLDTDSTTLDAREVAQICEFDRAALLRYIRTCEEQYLSWDASADDTDDADEANACRHEGQAWRSTAEKFRDALRLVVLPDDGRHDARPIA